MATTKISQNRTVCVCIFGSARLKPEESLLSNGGRYCQKNYEIGFGVITGGGPGIWKQGTKEREKATENPLD